MEEVEGVGGDMNAYTAEERTCYYAASAAEFFPRICDVLADIYLNPKLTPQDIERERGVIGEEILMYRDEPSSHVQEMLNAAYWPNHPLGRSLTGSLDTIEGFKREDFIDYRESHYHTGSTVFTAAGNIKHEDVVERAAKLFENLPKGRKPKFARPMPCRRRAGWSWSGAIRSRRNSPWACQARAATIRAVTRCTSCT